MISPFASALLISDLHLTPSMPLTAQRFFDFCEKDAPKVEAVFMLGDLFEYWVGDDAVLHSPFHLEVKRAIATLSTKVKTFYLHGNRDFLLGPEFISQAGMTCLEDPTKVTVAGHEYVLCHGDALCTADVGYQVFRSWVRKRWLQKLFLSLPAHWRKSIANHLRSNSGVQYQRIEHQGAEYAKRKTDVTTLACAAVLRDQSGSNLIHGHTHRPDHHQESLEGQEWHRWVLSDWDLDHPESGKPRASALLINDSGVSYRNLVKST